MQLRLVCGLVGALLCAALAPATPALASQRRTTAFEPAPCMFDNAAQYSESGLVCGYLRVPERHDHPDGPSIKLAVVIAKSTGANPAPDPLVLAQGGPGGSTIDTYVPLVHVGDMRRVLEDRDIVLFDQRGTLYSQPALTCPELLALTEQTIEQRLSFEEADRRSQAALGACRDRLAGAGVDFAAYNSLENAADIAALSEALGYEQINLYGVSYGTLLALHTLRGYPAILRSVILDAVVPPQINFQTTAPATFDRALSELFSACADDAGCRAAYPDIEGTLFATIDRLNANPARVPIRDAETGKTYNAVLDGDTFKDLMFQLLYLTPAIPLLPKMIYDAHDGEFGLLARLWPLLAFDRSVAYGMYFAVICAEDADFSPEDMQLEGVRPEIAEGQQRDAASLLATCARWDVPDLGPALDEPVASDTPTLVLNGRFDPITPPSFGEAAAQTLSRSYVFTFPNSGHGAFTGNACATDLVRAFLADPQRAPDGGCVAAQGSPTFVTPQNTLLTPVIDKLFDSLELGRYGTLAVLGLATLFMLSLFVIWPLSWLVRRLNKVPPEPGLPARLAPWLAVAVVVLTLAFVGGLVAAVVQVARQGADLVLFVGVPMPYGWLFILPPLVALLTAAMLVCAWLALRHAWWGFVRRIYYVMLALAALALSVALGLNGLMWPIFGALG